MNEPTDPALLALKPVQMALEAMAEAYGNGRLHQMATTALAALLAAEAAPLDVEPTMPKRSRKAILALGDLLRDEHGESCDCDTCLVVQPLVDAALAAAAEAAPLDVERLARAIAVARPDPLPIGENSWNNNLRAMALAIAREYAALPDTETGPMRGIPRAVEVNGHPIHTHNGEWCPLCLQEGYRLRAAAEATPLDGFVECPLCHEPERDEDMVAGVCLSCADAITYSHNARRGMVYVE